MDSVTLPLIRYTLAYLAAGGLPWDDLPEPEVAELKKLTLALTLAVTLAVTVTRTEPEP